MSPSRLLRVLRTLSVVTICILVVALGLVWTTRPHAAGPIVVNSLSDVANANDGLCTLREAIIAASNNVASGGVAGECAAGSASGSDAIDLTGVTGTINLTSALWDLSTDMTLTGPGSGQLTIRRSTADFYRIFHITAGTISISGITIRDGRAPDAPQQTHDGDGGGIRNFGALTLTDVIVTANQAGSSPTLEGGDGGGIANMGSLTMTNCSVTGNASGKTNQGHGGGIWNFGILTITNCVVSGNTTDTGSTSFPSGDGGGIYNKSTMTLTNTTVSNNTAGFQASGGGIYDGGNFSSPTAVITANTISNNSGANGAGVGGVAFLIRNSTISGNHGVGVRLSGGGNSLSNCTITANDGMGLSGSAEVINSIVAGNGVVTTDEDVSAGLTTLGHNLIGKSTSGSFTNAVNGDQVGTPGSPLDPHLASLANNGGPTQTHALLSGSTAINAADICIVQSTHCSGNPNLVQLNTDQRGFSRAVNGSFPNVVDIGAYEMQTPLANLNSSAATSEDIPTSIIFDGGDASTITPPVTASSSNTTLIPNDAAHLNLVMTGTTGTLTMTPVSNLNGNTDITITINRTSGPPDTRTFNLTVDPVNDAPSFTRGADQTVNEDSGAQTVNNWATSISPGPTDEVVVYGQTVHFNITGNTNPGLFFAAPAVSSSGTLTYTPAANANGSATITVTAQDDGGTASGGVDTSAPQTFTITVTAVNDAPSFTKGADQTVNEDAGAQTVNNWATGLSAGPSDESGQTLSFQVTGNTNASLFSAGPAVSSTGALTYTPAANATGSATISVVIKDNGGTATGGVDTSAAQSFAITVNAVNDPPSFTKGANQTVNEDAGAQSVTNWATGMSPGGGSDEAGQTLTFSITGNTNAALFSAGPAVSSSGTLTYTPAANANGSATITLTVQDDGGTANGGVNTSSQTFTITVTAVNDVPSFTKGADQTVNEDAGAQTISNWATGLSAGPADEAGQTLSFQITNNTNTALFSAGPAIGSTGTLTYAPAGNANGSATISVVIKDNGGTANGGVDTSAVQTFTITINPVNDAPSFTKGANQTVNEDAGAQTVSNWATSISAGPVNESGQIVSFTVTNNNNALFSSQPAVSSTGTLTYTPAVNANGSATVTVTAKDDGGTANGGVDTSASQTFTLTVNAVNDAPSFIKGADQTVNNNAGLFTAPNWATAISAGPANESGQTLSFQVTNNTNPGLFAGPISINSSTGNLAFTVTANAGGTATITIVLKDNGGTANGGVDTSASQTFTVTVVPAGGFVSFATATANTTENAGSTSVNVVRTGDVSRAISVSYATNNDQGVPCATANGVASPKCDFTAALGTLNFGVGETSKSLTILINQDSFVEGPETITVTLSIPTNFAALGTPNPMSVTIADDATEPPGNIIDDANTFVRMHYHDFLNREGDQSGIDFWTGQMTNCGSPDLLVCRVNVSGAFFVSIEFQQTGYLVERMYKTAYGDATSTSTFGGSHAVLVPVVRANEFLGDTQRIGRGVVVLQPGWETVLENNKQAYALEFVQNQRFTSALPTSLTPSQFVDKLNQNAGMVLSPSERTTAINLFGIAADTANVNARAQALRQIAEAQDLFRNEFNRAFVLAQYIGYLRRNPNDAPEPTQDYTGYDFWLTKLNQFNGDYIAAEMVKAFIASDEYRKRFGP